MRRLVGVILFVFACCNLSWAEKPATPANIGGDKKGGITIEILFDWSNALYDDGDPLIDELGGDYTKIVKHCEREFIKGINRKNYILNFVPQNPDARYTSIFTVENLDHFFIPPRHRGKVWGTLTITDRKEDVMIFRAKVKAVIGRDFYPSECYEKAFYRAGKELNQTIMLHYPF